MQNYLEQLNEAQRKPVLKTEGPSMIIAGAGSGKTRVLTYRIAHLMEKGVDSFNILSLTFTNKAAKEMKERISMIVGVGEARNLWMGTFHSVFARILRIEGERLGYPSNFTIYDAEDARKTLANIIKEKSLDKDIYKTKSVMSRISSYKNNLVTPKVYANRAELIENDTAARMPLMGEIYRDYCERCFRSGAMDFDDLLLKTNELLFRFPEVLAKYQTRFKYIMVDEYQDTNHSQYLIVKSLAAKFENLCVVGDDAQSIYAFRGANIRNILNFQKDYADAEIFKLEQNYRSTKHIVQAANSVIKKNKDQLEKDVWTHNDEGEKIVVHKSISDTDEGNYVAQRIWDSRMNEHLPYNSYCILYRTNAQSRSFEDALRKKNIPYRINGSTSFYQRKEIKDLISYFRIVINHKDEEALRRVINYPARGIGQTTMNKLTVKASEQGTSMWEVAANVHQNGIALNNPTKQKILDFVMQIKSYAAMIEKGDAFDVAAHIAKSSRLIHTLGEDKTPEGIGRYENIQELLNGVKDFSEEQKQIEGGNPSLANYLQDIALLTDSDKKDDGEPKVTLMTIHLAKGLEFPYVFIVGLEENLFPSMMTVNSRSDLEEERRLFYVALTRAEKRAYLTYAHTRYRWGKLIDCEPSRFIKDIDERHLDIQVPEFSPTFNPSADELSGAFGDGVSFSKPRRFASNANGFKPKQEQPVRKPNPVGMKKVSHASGGNTSMPAVSSGDRVLHDRFGLGVIEEIVGEGASKKAVVMFDNAGKKNLLLKFAKLQKV